MRKRNQFRKFHLVKSSRMMFCFGLVYNLANTQPSLGITSSKSKHETLFCQAIVNPRCWNRCGRRFGLCPCHAKWGFFCGEHARLLFQQNPTYCGDEWLMIQRVPCVHSIVRTFSTLCGHVRHLHRSRMRTISGILENTWVSKMFHNFCTMSLSRVVVQIFLQWRFGWYGSREIKSG